MANEIMIFGKKVDDGGVVGLFSREHPDHKLDEQQLDRFEYFCVLHQTRLAELLDDYPRLIVRWEDDDEEATVYLIPAGTVLISQPRSAVPSVTMRFTSVRAAESQMSQERPKTFTRRYLEQQHQQASQPPQVISPEEQAQETRGSQQPPPHHMVLPKYIDPYQGPSKPLEQMSPEELEEWEEIQGMQRHIFKRTAPQAPASPKNPSR